MIVASMVAIAWRSTGAQQQAPITALPLPTIAANGTMRLQTDLPLASATVGRPLIVGGWALDLASSSGSGVDAVHVWAVPAAGSPIFVGVATLGGVRNDVAAVFGAQFATSGFNLASNVPLPSGPIELDVYGRRASTGTSTWSIA